MKSWLSKLFSSETSVSSKRVFGGIAFLAMIYKVCIMNDSDLVLWVLVISATMLGLETLMNFAKRPT